MGATAQGSADHAIHETRPMADGMRDAAAAAADHAAKVKQPLRAIFSVLVVAAIVITLVA